MVLRTLWNIGAGVVHHALGKKALAAGEGVLFPVKWRARTGFLDCDVNLHLNNASYLYSMELARWHFAGAVGMMPLYAKRQMMFLVASSAIRYRHSIAPFQAYEIQTQIVHWDDSWAYFLQQFVCPTTGKMFAEALCRATIRERGNKPVTVGEIYRETKGLELEAPQEMPKIVEEFLKWDAASRVSMESADAAGRAACSGKKPPKGLVENAKLSWNNPIN